LHITPCHPFADPPIRHARSLANSFPCFHLGCLLGSFVSLLVILHALSHHPALNPLNNYTISSCSSLVSLPLHDLHGVPNLCTFTPDRLALLWVFFFWPCAQSLPFYRCLLVQLASLRSVLFASGFYFDVHDEHDTGMSSRPPCYLTRIAHT